MITDNGKDIISKYLLGQVSSYATHIAIGCGAEPLAIGDSVPSGLNEKGVLDFEMARVPITSKGFVDDNGTTKMSLTAELPAENRYEITEVGLWSAPSNSLAINSDSHLLFDFTSSWQSHGTSITQPQIETNLGSDGTITTTKTIFYTPSDDINLHGYERRLRKEGPRFLNQNLFIRGDTSTISGSTGSWAADSGSTHIHLNNVNFNIGNNSPSDTLTLAFSLIDKDYLGSGDPDYVKIFIEFYRNEISTSNGYAKKEIYISGTDFTNNRYKSITFPISSLITSSDFSAKDIKVCRIFTSVIKSGTPSTSHYIAFDGMRVDNIITDNPIYKLTGYSIVKANNAHPIVKNKNSNNYIEFRFNLGIA